MYSVFVLCLLAIEKVDNFANFVIHVGCEN